MAKYAIMRNEKRGMGDLKDIERENNREKEIPLPRSDIDWSKTKYNIFLVRSDNFPATVKKILDENGVKARKNSVVSIDSLFTASPEFMEKMTKEERLEYFLECLDFAREHYGVVYNAVIHVDETGAEHLHVMSVPLIFEEGGKVRLSARDMMGGRTDYHERQTEFFEKVGEKRGMDRGEVREADEVVKHLDTLRYKEKMVKEEIKKAEIEKAEIIQETEKAEVYKAKLEAEIGKLDEIREQVRPLPFSVSQLFRNIGEAVKAGYNNLCAKIEHMETIFSRELRAAFCKMCAIGKGLFSPETISGKRLEWYGNKPVYKREEGGIYKPSAIEDIDGAIHKDFDRDEWRETFPVYARMDISPEQDQERDIISRIEKIKDIVCGKKQEIDQLRAEDEIEVREIDGRFVPVDGPDKDEEPEYYAEIEREQQPSASIVYTDEDEDEEQDAFDLSDLDADEPDTEAYREE